MAYFPRLRLPNPLRDNQLETFVPSGAIAGLIARTDATRGVWKAPAGIDASLSGVRELSYRLTDGENGRLNPLGLNCLRTITPFGHISWGGRTLAGDDRNASEWKYIPVRRTALFIEESLYRGLHWVVFEPNGEALWQQIRLNVGTFMQGLFRQDAFQGTTPREAFLVKCDRETNPQNLIDQGIVTVYVGFAPLKPAEFVIIQIQQLAGQLEV
jgi:phage tail sheath protein FI